MTEDEEWRTREQMMAHLSRSERTLQVMVRDGRLERRVGEDKRAYYRVAQQLAAPQRDAAEAPPWAVELLEEIRALRAENAAYRASQAQIEDSTQRSATQHRSDPQHPWWKRLLSAK